MNMMDRKSKMVSFRLSQEEYRLLRDACDANGARNISELARYAMQTIITTRNGTITLHGPRYATQPLRQEVDHLRSQIHRLTAEVEELARRLEPSAAD